MKRRNFGLFAGTSTLALLAGEKFASAQTAMPDASLLTTTLTPLGAERAGNAAGTIPAWTGGLTAIPAGFDWDPDKTQPPDFFASDAMLYEVNAANLAQYAHLVTEGVQTLIQKQGYFLQVYPTRRTAAAPQWVYDHTAANVGRAKLNPAGGRLGFLGGYGGPPFPIPSIDTPIDAGAQIIWNHGARWNGEHWQFRSASFAVQDGGLPILSNGAYTRAVYPYYSQAGGPENFDGLFYKLAATSYAPSNLVGNEIVYYDPTNPYDQPVITWQLLAGQGRVRKAPEVAYDTPDQYAGGICGYDENSGFSGSLEKYDFKYIGKAEMLIPYNNNALLHLTSFEAHQPRFLNAKSTRWELHRVWVVEATLHPGERNVLPRRRFYVDEDTWIIGITDAWDANNDIYHLVTNVDALYPNVPGRVYSNSFIYNLQTGNYCSIQGSYVDPPYGGPMTFNPVPESNFDPQEMAASASY